MGYKLDRKPGWEPVKRKQKKLYTHLTEPGDWRRKKRTGAKKRRYVVGLYARKALRLIKRGGIDEEAGWRMLKFREWTFEQAVRYANEDWRIPKVVGLSRDVRGMKDWQRRFG